MTIPYKEGITQIDHVVISNFGVIVIETKNYKGIICGDVEDDYWYKTCFGRSTRFYNPIKQNQKHVNAIETIIRNEDIPVYNLVVFINGCKIDSDFGDFVIYEKMLISRVLKYKKKVMTNKERKILCYKICENKL